MTNPIYDPEFIRAHNEYLEPPREPKICPDCGERLPRCYCWADRKEDEEE